MRHESFIEQGKGRAEVRLSSKGTVGKSSYDFIAIQYVGAFLMCSPNEDWRESSRELVVISEQNCSSKWQRYVRWLGNVEYLGSFEVDRLDQRLVLAIGYCGDRAVLL
jgi:hypothetical protein